MDVRVSCIDNKRVVDFGGSIVDKTHDPRKNALQSNSQTLKMFLEKDCRASNFPTVNSRFCTPPPRQGISSMFIGVILLPIIGNAVEHAAAITMAICVAKGLRF